MPYEEIVKIVMFSHDLCDGHQDQSCCRYPVGSGEWDEIKL